MIDLTDKRGNGLILGESPHQIDKTADIEMITSSENVDSSREECHSKILFEGGIIYVQEQL